MKKTLLGSLIAIALLTGCSAVYQSGQTPDDLYYSAGKDINEYAVVNNAEAGERYQEYVSTMDDRYLRMKVANRNQWSSIDNNSYWNDMRYNFPAASYNYSYFNPYTTGMHFGLSSGLGNYNPYNPWNNWGVGAGLYGYGNGLGWSNPAYTLIAYVNPKLSLPATSTAGSNLNAYRNRSYNNYNGNGGKGDWGTPSTSGSGNNSFGSLVRQVFSNPSSNGGSNTNYDRPARTFSTPASSSGNASYTNPSAGGSSGGFKSTGTSTSTGRGGRDN